MIQLMPPALPTALLALLAPFTGAAAAQQQPNATEAWTAFQKLPVARQQQAAAEFVEALPALPCGGTALHALAAIADAPQHERTKERASQRASRTIDFQREPEALPRRVDYVFGVGVIEARDGKEKDKHAAPAKPAGKPPAKPAAEPAAKPAGDVLVLRQALLGCVPDADKVLAVLLQRLDTDAHGDAFAAFLQSWRNDDESFYEALDRTAGTKDSVFFFDAMLNDFRGQFAKGEHKLGGGLQEAHDALHAAFLSYRQYRGFREALAWSLVLPPDAPLPARLRRYEEKVEGGYSLRQQVTMVAKALEHDVEKVLDAALKDAPPLPQPVWKQAYDPYPTWTARFQALQTKMIEAAGSTDAYLAEAETERRNFATAIGKLALERVQQAIADSKAH